MRTLLRSFALVIAACFVVIVLTTTFIFVKAVVLGKSKMASKGFVGVVELKGMIIDSRELIDEIDTLEENPQFKALVVRINSPGGMVAPSEELYKKLRKTDEKIPVIVSMSSLAASGGYYTALGGRKIFANGGTLTASIGVLMEFVNAGKLLEWAKIERYTLKSGKFKAIGASYRKMTPEETALLQTMIDSIYQQFRGTVKERRGLSDEVLDTVADGRVMTGTQALEAKLVDEIGTLEAAIAEAKTAAGLPADAYVHYPEEEVGLIEKLLFGERHQSSYFRNLLESNGQAVLPSANGWTPMYLAPLR